jgi:hypothetical protein
MTRSAPPPRPALILLLVSSMLSAVAGCKGGGQSNHADGGSGGSGGSGGTSGSGGQSTGTGGGSGGMAAGTGGSGSGGNSGSGGAAASGGTSGTTCAPPTDIDQPIVKLSDTGCMSASTPTAFAASVFPYSVNSPLWSDNADKARGFVLPSGGKIHVKKCADPAENCSLGATDPDDGKWVFPVGTVMVKNFSFDNKVVETRLFVHHDDATWVGYSYAWSEDQTGATIVSSDGAEVMFKTGSRTVDWHYPSRDGCMKCHKPTGGDTLGPETDQMNRMGSGTMNQIDMLKQMNAFDQPPATPYKDALVTPYASQVGTPAASATVEQKARSYLQANCAFCHRPDDPDYFLTDMRYGVAFADMGLCGQDPQKSDLGVIGSKRLDPGNPMNSLMWLRMEAPPDDANGRYGRMPPLASYTVDDAGAQLISDWISGIPGPCPMPSM